MNYFVDEKTWKTGSKASFVSFAFAALFLFSALVLPAQLVSADGMGFIHDKDMWRNLNERKQYAAINYADGTQKMILLINADLAGDEAVWLFPVPAAPEDVAIDVVKGFPQLRGNDLEHEKPVANAFTLSRLTQVYALPLMAIYYLGLGFLGQTGGYSESRVFEHVEKMGLTTELVTASDSNALAQYLNEKGLSLPSNANEILSGYFGGEYSFVVSWVSDVNAYKQQTSGGKYGRDYENALGVFVSFPTDKPFFPLKPTSFYGEAKIPVNIYVAGFVQPELFDGVKSAKTTYFVQSRYDVPAELEEFFGKGGAVNNFEYTKVEFNVPSRLFTQDLWFEAKPPAKIALASFAYQNSWLFVAIIIALCSMIASVAAALIVFRGNHPHLPKFTLLGLANVLTILGFSFATSKLNVGESFVEKKVVPVPNAKGFKATKTVLLWSVAFALLLSFVFFGASISYSSPASALFVFIVLLALFFIAAMFLTIAWRAVFEPSSLTKNNWFVIVFSIAFLVATAVFEFALNAVVS